MCNVAKPVVCGLEVLLWCEALTPHKTLSTRTLSQFRNPPNEASAKVTAIRNVNGRTLYFLDNASHPVLSLELVVESVLMK